MKLTLLLFRRNRLPNGHIFRGKDRLVQKVQPRDLNHLRRSFAIEEKNMFYLRFPYLTEEESFGHAKALDKHAKKIEVLKEQQHRIFKQDVTLYERLGHLRVSESWE